MPLLFGKRRRRLAAASAVAALDVGAGARGRDGCRGGGLAAVWDLPIFTGDSEPDDQPPAKVMIQERDGASGDDGATPPATAELVDGDLTEAEMPLPPSPPPTPPPPLEAEDLAGDGGGGGRPAAAGVPESDVEAAAAPGTPTPPPPPPDPQDDRLQEVLELRRLAAELGRSERCAQEAVLGLRRDLMRLEGHSGRLEAALESALEGHRAEQARLQASLQEALARLSEAAARAQRVEDDNHALRQSEAALRDKLEQYELQLQQLQQLQLQHDQQQQQGFLAADGYVYPVSSYPAYYPAPLPQQQQAVVAAATSTTSTDVSSTASSAAAAMHGRAARRRWRQCYNCQRFGHDARDCAGDTTCVVCAAVGHTHRECVAADKRCANCGGGHLASYKACPARADQCGLA